MAIDFPEFQGSRVPGFQVPRFQGPSNRGQEEGQSAQETSRVPGLQARLTAAWGWAAHDARCVGDFQAHGKRRHCVERDTLGRAPTLSRHRPWDEDARHGGGLVWHVRVASYVQDQAPATRRAQNCSSWHLRDCGAGGHPKVWRKGEQGQVKKRWARTDFRECGAAGHPKGLGKIDSIGAADNSTPPWKFGSRILMYLH